MFSFARRPQASQRSLGQPWLFIFFARRVASTIRARVRALAALEVERLSGVQACSLGPSATATASLDLERLLPAFLAARLTFAGRFSGSTKSQVVC